MDGRGLRFRGLGSLRGLGFRVFGTGGRGAGYILTTEHGVNHTKVPCIIEDVSFD